MVKKLVTAALAAVAIDQLTKQIVLKKLESTAAIIPNVFELNLVKNTGAGFGILAGQTAILIAVSVIVLVFIIYYATKIKEHQEIPVGLILGGLFGNLIDRIFLGHVVDFLDFQVWPVFNIADSCLTVGVVWLIVQALMEKKKK